MKDHMGTKWPTTGRIVQLDFDEEENLLVQVISQ